MLPEDMNRMIFPSAARCKPKPPRLPNSWQRSRARTARESIYRLPDIRERHLKGGLLEDPIKLLPEVLHVFAQLHDRDDLLALIMLLLPPHISNQLPIV